MRLALLGWFGFVPECRNSPVETPGTTVSPGALPLTGCTESSEVLGHQQEANWTSGFGLHFAIISPQHSDLPDDWEVSH